MKPRFYCENCGSQVRAGAASCPTCGSRFTAVRCPKCGYNGRESEFRSGCPVCGYMVQQQPPVPAAPRKRAGGFLPSWFYRLAAIALLAALLVLLVILLTRT